MKRLKRQEFKALGITLKVPAQWELQDCGYQKNLWNFYQHINKIKNLGGWPEWKGPVERFDFKHAQGYSLAVAVRDEARGYPHYHFQAFIGYLKSPNRFQDLCIRAHEESHAADYLGARKELLDKIDSQYSLYPEILDNLLRLDLETVADIGMVFALRKAGLSFGEIRDIALSISYEDIAPLILGAFEEAQGARL
jgi:hypothetical protein